MAKVTDVYGDHKPKPPRDFEPFPQHTRLVCTIEEATAYTSGQANIGTKLVLKVRSYPSDLTGYAKGRIWDSRALMFPKLENMVRNMDDADRRKWENQVGIFLHNLKVLGIEEVPDEYNQEAWQRMVCDQLVGKHVLIRADYEEANESFDRPANRIGGFLEATEKTIDKYGLRWPQDEESPDDDEIPF